MPNFFLLVVFALIFCSSPLKAQTVRDTVEKALNLHPSVEAAVASLEASQQEKRAQISGFFPEVTVTGQGGRIFGDNSVTRGFNTSRGEAYSGLGEGSVALTQMLYDGQQTQNRARAAHARILSADSTLQEVQSALALRAIQAHANLARTQKGLVLLEDHKGNINDYISRIKSSVDSGGGDASELQQAKEVEIVISGLVADFQGQYNASLAEYFEVTGEMPPVEMQDPDVLEGIDLDQINTRLDAVLDNHPSVHVSKMNVRAAKYDSAVEQGVLFPEIDGELSYLKSDKRDVIGGEIEDARAVIKLNWAFSTGGERFARMRQSQLVHKEEKARLDEKRRQVRRGVELALAEYETAQKKIELASDREALNRNLFGTYQNQFEGASISLLQLMQSHNQYFNAQLETHNAQYRGLIAGYALVASLGELNGIFQQDEDAVALSDIENAVLDSGSIQNDDESTSE